MRGRLVRWNASIDEGCFLENVKPGSHLWDKHKHKRQACARAESVIHEPAISARAYARRLCLCLRLSHNVNHAGFRHARLSDNNFSDIPERALYLVFDHHYLATPFVFFISSFLFLFCFNSAKILQVSVLCWYKLSCALLPYHTVKISVSKIYQQTVLYKWIEFSVFVCLFKIIARKEEMCPIWGW